MSCENPLILLNPRYKKMSTEDKVRYSQSNFDSDVPPDLYVSVPCGQCHECQKKRMRDYHIRLMYEVYKYPNSLFITLTFDNDHLQMFSDDPNRAVRLFLDRVRKKFGKSVRHWIVSEFGTLNGRLHYHGILFNAPLGLDTTLLSQLWSYGFIYLGYCDERTAKYITKYVTKSINNGKKPPRIISSKGIGEGYLSPENVAFHKDPNGAYRPYFKFGSFKVPLPRYYYSKIYSEFDKIKMLIDRELNPQPTYVNGVKYYNTVDSAFARKALHERNLSLRLSPRRKIKVIKASSITNNSNFNG